jgi:hypothetical protein
VDGWVDEWLDGLMSGWKEGRKEGWMSGWMDKHMDSKMAKRMFARMDLVNRLVGTITYFGLSLLGFRTKNVLWGEQAENVNYGSMNSN